MKDYISPEWYGILEEQGLCGFSALWEKELSYIEEPNSGRGKNGWSGVSLLPLEIPGMGRRNLVLKRQFNHVSRSLRHPFSGIPTVTREFHNILLYREVGVPTVVPVFHAVRKGKEGTRAVLVTEYLEGYSSLEELIAEWEENGWQDLSRRCRIIETAARVLRKLHRNGIVHKCMYPKHIFVKETGQTCDVRLIDLEKSRNGIGCLGNGGGVRDLESLHRHTGQLTHADRMRFLTAYCGKEIQDAEVELLAEKIKKRTRSKRA